MSAALPPGDWNDIGGWDRYHSEADWADRCRHAYLTMKYARTLRDHGYRRLWLPGCGTSLAPLAYAAAGFSVVATDVSPVALDAQRRSRDEGLEEATLARILKGSRGTIEPARGGQLTVVQHDMRERWRDGSFGAILNIRSFQGFDPATMRLVARSHIDALEPGGWAVLETQNVQGEARNRLEDALLEAGACLPYNEAERWLRREIAATGLPVTFILGRPMVRCRDGYVEQPGDQERLDALRAQHAERRRELIERQGPPPDDAKIATVVYSTG